MDMGKEVEMGYPYNEYRLLENFKGPEISYACERLRAICRIRYVIDISCVVTVFDWLYT